MLRLAFRTRLALGATRVPIMQAALSLCDSAGPPRPQFDPLGRPLHELTEPKDAEAKEEGGRRGERGEAEEGIDAPSSARSPRQPWGNFARPDRSDRGGSFVGGGGFGGGFGGRWRARGHDSPPADADMMAFQAYVRRRLGQMDEEMFPAKRSTQAEAELAFLEEQVAEDEMHRKRRKLRSTACPSPTLPDPLHALRLCTRSPGTAPSALSAIVPHCAVRALCTRCASTPSASSEPFAGTLSPIPPRRRSRTPTCRCSTAL